MTKKARKDYGPDPEGDDMAARIREKWRHRVMPCPNCGTPIVALKIEGGIRDLTIYVPHGSKPGQAQAWHHTFKRSQHEEHECRI